MTDDTPPVLYISADTSDLTTRYKATPRMHMGANAWIPRDAVRVKPLEWEGANHFWRARTPTGDTYEILEAERHFHWSRISNGHGTSLTPLSTLVAAKAAAQADFEARIMSALAALPAPDEGAQEEGE